MFNKSYTNAWYLTVTCLMVSIIGGCRENTGRVPVTGHVKLDGKPLSSGIVAFIGESGYSIASGVIRDGYYQIAETSNLIGVAPGHYGVQFESWIEPPGNELPGGGFSKGVSAIPQKYQSYKDSGLEAVVNNDTRTIDFEIVTK